MVFPVKQKGELMKSCHRRTKTLEKWAKVVKRWKKAERNQKHGALKTVFPTFHSSYGANALKKWVQKKPQQYFCKFNLKKHQRHLRSTFKISPYLFLYTSNHIAFKTVSVFYRLYDLACPKENFSTP